MVWLAGSHPLPPPLLDPVPEEPAPAPLVVESEASPVPSTTTLPPQEATTQAPAMRRAYEYAVVDTPIVQATSSLCLMAWTARRCKRSRCLPAGRSCLGIEGSISRGPRREGCLERQRHGRRD